MASDQSDTDSEVDVACSNSSLAPKLSVILEQVKQELPSVDLNWSDESSDEEVAVFQRSGPVSVLSSSKGPLPSEEWNKEQKDQVNGGIQTQSGKNAHTSVGTSTSFVEMFTMPNTCLESTWTSGIGVTRASERDTTRNIGAVGGLFGALEEALMNPGGGRVIDLGELEANINSNENVLSTPEAVSSCSEGESVRFSTGFLERVESALLNQDFQSGFIELEDVLDDESQVASLEIQELPWERITFTDGFLQRVESELASQNAPTNVINVDLESYDLCDVDLLSSASASRNPTSSTEQASDVSNTSPQTSQQQESQNVISRYFTEDTQMTLLDSLRNINLDELLLNESNRENIPASNQDRSLMLSNSLPTHPEQGEGSTGPSLMEQLAKLSSSQSGVDITQLDLQSGARLKTTKIATKQEKTEQNLQEVREKAISDLANTPRSIGTGLSNERPPEPSTVFLDLRNFDAEKQRQEAGVQAVQRILKARPVIVESSSDDEDEEEQSSRSLWHEQRRRMKAVLAAGQMTVQHPTKENLPEQAHVHKGETNLRTSSVDAPLLTRKEKEQGDDIQKKMLERDQQELTSDACGMSDEEEMSEVSSVGAEEEIEEERPGMVGIRGSGEIEVDLMKHKEDEAKMLKAEQERIIFEKKRKQQESRIRLHERLNSLRPTVSSRGRQNAAGATPTIYDIDASYESKPSSLPQDMDASVDTLLLSVRLSSNGEMIAHRAKNSKSVDTGDGLSASYVALLTWLLSLVPDNFDFLDGDCETKTAVPTEEGTPFQVISLQQLFLQDQLTLLIAICPSEAYVANASHSTKSSTQDRSRATSGFQQVIHKFLSTNTLHSVCWWLQDLTSIGIKGPASKSGDAFLYMPPLPVITKRPLATFIQVNPDPTAVQKVFQMDTSFFWTTVENDESSCDLDLKEGDTCHDDLQNTMSLIYKKVYREPRSVMGILNRLPQEGLDLAGVRLVYPSLSSLKPELNGDPRPKDVREALNKVGPIAALAIRGNCARQIWLDAIGPSDPILARKTDPQSLCALYGGNSRNESLLFTPRNPTRILFELSLWFGPRVPSSGVVNVGQVQRPSGVGEGKCSEEEIDSLPNRPPSTLSATTRGDIVLAISPFVPVQWFGILLNMCQARGYQLRGLRRSRLSVKKVSALGVSAKVTQYFQGVTTDSITQGSPSTLLLLNKENALHHAGSLIELFMVRLTMMGLLGELQHRIQDPITSEMLFRHTAFSYNLLTSLGGEFSRVQDIDVHTTPGYISPQLHNNPELEQVCVLTVTGSSQIKSLGQILDQLLRPSSHSSQVFELVGIKWFPSLSNMQARELTPYEVGDKLWKQSVQMLMSRQAVILALRGVNALHRLKNLFKSKSPYSALSDLRTSLDRLLSPSVDIAFEQIRFFFSDKELFPDNKCRSLLAFLPPATRMFQTGRVHPYSKPREEVLEESVLSSMLQGPRPITTVLVVKPDGTRHLAKILKKISQEGFKVVGMKMKVMSRSEVKVIVESETKGNAAVEELHISHVTKDSSVILCLQRENAVKHLVDLIGPADPREARRCEAGYMRGVYGSDPVANALHGSMNYEASVKEIKSLFPEGLCCTPTIDLDNEEIPCPAVDKAINIEGLETRLAKLRIVDSQTNPMGSHGEVLTASDLGKGVQTTLGPHVSALTQTNCLVLMPSLVRTSRSARTAPYVSIIEQLLRKGCELVGMKMLWLTEEQAQRLLHVIDAGSYQMAPELTSGPCVVIAIQGDNAILTFDAILGGSFDKDSLFSKHSKSILSGKDSKMAAKMVAFFFESLVKNSQLEVYLP